MRALLGRALDSLAARLADQLLARQSAGPISLSKNADAGPSLPQLTQRPAFQGLYVGGDTVLTTLANGLPVYVDSRDLSLAPHIMREGRWEWWIATHWLSLVKPGHAVADVGANFGYYTMLGADRVGETGRVASFEPDPRNFDILAANVAINGFRGRVETHRAAVAEQAGTLTFWSKKRETGGSGLTEPSAQSLAALHDSASSSQVQAVTLDEALSHWDRLDLLKVDAEGAEVRVLRGARGILGRSPDVVILLEFDAGMFADQGHELLEVLGQYGFMAEAMHEDGSLRPVGLDQLRRAGARADLLLRR